MWTVALRADKKCVAYVLIYPGLTHNTSLTSINFIMQLFEHDIIKNIHIFCIYNNYLLFYNVQLVVVQVQHISIYVFTK